MHDLRATTLKNISKEVDAETKKIKSAAIPVNHLFGGEEYVKVKKNDWNKIMDAFSRAVSRNYLLEKYEKKIFALEKKIATLTDQIEKLKQFVASRGDKPLTPFLSTNHTLFLSARLYSQ